MRKSNMQKSKNKKLNTNKGITLIALVITIIVMLILVSVTISMAINGGLFEKAGEAVGEMQNAIDVEQQLANGEIKIGDTWYNSIDDYLAGIESVKSLQEKHEFTYYSSLAKAVEDVNNNTRDNADASKETAVAGIYTENEKHFVVLLKDNTETTSVKPSVDMTINLGGNKLTTTDVIAVDLTAGNLVIDGKLNGSGIEKTNTSNAAGILVQTAANTNLIVTGGSYNVSTDGTSCMAFLISGKGSISDSIIRVTETTRGGAGFYVLDGGEATISNCNIAAKKLGDGWNMAYAILNYGTAIISNCDMSATTAIYGGSRCVANDGGGIATISNCDIRAYANYSDTSSSVGVASTSGILTITDCYVMGVHSGLQNHGTLYVNGGTYEGYLNGGFYFAGTGTTVYVRNATISQCEMPDGYTTTSTSTGAGFVIGRS